MTQPMGFYMPLSLPRRNICDLMQFARGVPSVPVERTMNLARLQRAREIAHPRPGWCAIFTKAWGRVCASRPVLRRTYMGWPFGRLYQHPISVASVAVECPYGDETAVFQMQVNAPEQKSLLEIDGRLRNFQNRALGSAGGVRRQLVIARLPWPLRYALWWWTLNVSGREKAKYFGTYNVSVYSHLGAESLHPRGVLTTMLNYGVIAPNGDVRVRIVYDHRVMDGAVVARAMEDLESVLNHEILAELRYLESVEAA